MKIIGISTSPRKGRNTEFALATALNSARERGEGRIESELISLHDKTVKPCLDCDYCRKNFDCSIKDDDFDLIMDKLKDPSLKGLIVASPVYFGSMNAQAKALLDRSVVFRRNGFALRNCVAAALAVGGSRNGGQELTLQAIQAAFLIHDMIVVSDGRETAHFGGTGWERCPGGMKNDEVSMETFKNLGRRVAELVIRLNPDGSPESGAVSG